MWYKLKIVTNIYEQTALQCNSLVNCTGSISAYYFLVSEERKHKSRKREKTKHKLHNYILTVMRFLYLFNNG